MTTATTSPVVAPRADGLQYRQRMDDALRDAIEQTDLPGLVGRYYPDSGARPGRKEVVFAVWRGDEHESFSLFKGDGGTWLYRDHRTRETGNAFGFLTDICGLSKAEAAEQLKAGAGAEPLAPSPQLPAKRKRKAKIEAGDVVHEALWRAVNEGRIVSFKHPLSQALLSRENAHECIRSALETPSRDSQRILEAAHAALKDLARRKKRQRRCEGKPVAFYDYVDERGKLLYQVVRFEPKGFSQRRPHGDGWAWGVTEDVYVRGQGGNLYLDDDAPADAERVPLDACRQVLYRLPNVKAAAGDGRSVHIVEGEEDVHALEALGLVATCNPGGALKWEEAYTETLRGCAVYILPDFDEAGEQHAQLVYEMLSGVARRLRIVRLPGLPPAGDVCDWLKTHDRRELIVELARLGPGGC